MLLSLGSAAVPASTPQHGGESVTGVSGRTGVHTAARRRVCYWGQRPYRRPHRSTEESLLLGSAAVPASTPQHGGESVTGVSGRTAVHTAARRRVCYWGQRPYRRPHRSTEESLLLGSAGAGIMKCILLWALMIACGGGGLWSYPGRGLHNNTSYSDANNRFRA
ncbi:unnamed protein product [Boreogadus saida]